MATRAILATLLTGALAASASAGELVEMRDGTLVEADRVDVVKSFLVLHVEDGEGGVAQQVRVRLRDVDPKSATRAWAATLGHADTDGWLGLAGYARRNALFDVAAHGYERAASGSDAAAEALATFRAARPREESRHHFEQADELLRARRHEAAATAARAAVKADAQGPYGAMAADLLEIVAATPKRAPVRSAAKQDLRVLRRLEPLVKRGEARLRQVTRVKGRDRIAVLVSATRVLRDASARLVPLTSSDVHAEAREPAAKLHERVQLLRVEGLLLLADLRRQSGADASALTAVHEALAIVPDDRVALDLRKRLLDDAEAEDELERDLLARGARRRYHAWPYPARNSRTGMGFEPTRDPIRGLGRLPYSRPAWDERYGDGGVVVIRRRR